MIVDNNAIFINNQTVMTQFPSVGDIAYDTDKGKILTYTGDNWSTIVCSTDYQAQLENIPISEIERYLRNKKLENIKILNEI